MRRKFLQVLAAFAMAFATVLSGGALNVAEANSTLQNRINSIQQERSDKQKEAEQKEQEVKVIETKLNTLEEEIRVLDHKTAETNQKLREKEQQVAATKQRIEELTEEIRVLEERIAERDQLLKDRVRSMYKNGGSVNFLEVVLGSKNFGDLVNRVNALNTIAQQDRNILEAHHNDKMALEDAKQEVETALLNLETQLNELEQLKAELESQRIEKDRLMAQLEQEEGELLDELAQLEESDEILAAQERAMQQELKAWEERQKQLEEERKRQQQQVSRSSGPSVAHSAPSQTTEGTFMRPATGTVTSFFGPRWGRFHYGIDIGKNGRTGDVPIVAVEAGTVIRSYYSTSYGNTVMISHNVNGRVITTLYAHLENRLVTDGQRVEKGQLLGYMGNTGRSFGAHLHFEVHEGPWNAAKSNAVDPLKYIPR